MEQKTDYILAKEIVDTLKIHGELLISPIVVGNFRKYLRDFTRNTKLEFITKKVDGKIRVTRLK